MRRIGATLGWLVGWGSLGCGPNVGDPSLDPCESDQDCGQGGLCEAGRCITFDDSSGTSDDGSPPADVTGDDPDGSTTEGGTDGGCIVNSDCPMEARCGDAGQCIDLLSSECTVLRWPDSGERDDVVFVGSILPSSLPGADLTIPFQNAAKLAVEHFDNNTALQGDRRIAWVGCEDGGLESATAAAQHLVDDVGVSAIVGPFSDPAEIATSVTVPAGVLLMTPFGGTETILDLDDQDLVWQTLADDEFQGTAMGELLVEEQPANLLLLVQDTPHGDEMAQRIVGAIESEPSPGPFLVTTYADPASFVSEEDMLASYAATLAGALGELPEPYVEPEDHYTHVVIVGDVEAMTILWLYLTVWKTTLQIPDQPSPPMPRFYFMSNGVVALEHAVNRIGDDPMTQGFADDKAQVLEQLQGVSPVVTDAENFEVFSILYKARFDEQDPLPVMSLAYDAMMAVELAMTTVPPDEEITGAALAAALPRLDDPDGAFVTFGDGFLGFVEEIRNTLVTNGSVDVQGISGELDWDDRGGVRANVEHSRLVDLGTPEDPFAQRELLRLYRLSPSPARDGDWD